MPRAAAENSRRREAARSRILDGSVAAFAEKGFHTASMDDVAASAGVSKGLAYFYFGSKEALFEQVLRERLAHLFDVGDTIDASAPPRVRLAALIDGLLTKIQQQPDLFRLYLALSMEKSLVEVAARTRRELGAPFERYLAIVRDICADLGSPEPEVDALLLRSALLGVALRHVRGIEGDIPLAEVRERLITLFAGGDRRPRTRRRP